MVSTPEFIGHHTFWLRHFGWCSLWYSRGPGSPARYLHRSHSTVRTLGGYRLTAIGIFLFTVVPQWQHVPAKPLGFHLRSGLACWSNMYLSLSPPSYVVNQGGKEA